MQIFPQMMPKYSKYLPESSNYSNGNKMEAAIDSKTESKKKKKLRGIHIGFQGNQLIGGLGINLQAGKCVHLFFYYLSYNCVTDIQVPKDVHPNGEQTFSNLQHKCR